MKKSFTIPLSISVAVFLVTCATIFFISCQKKKVVTVAYGTEVSLQELGSDIYFLNDETQLWHESDRAVCVVFGYGYNDKNFVDSTVDALFSEFGSFEDGGAIIPLTFPDDFRHGSKAYITNLEGKLSDKSLCGIILLGAPENTAEAIARITDAYDGLLPFPVFSFFSQDEEVPMENCADFVLDVALDNKKPLSEETQVKRVSSLPQILSRSISIMRGCTAPFKKTTEIIDLVKLIAEPLPVTNYIDAQTGLMSVNHFLISEPS